MITRPLFTESTYIGRFKLHSYKTIIKNGSSLTVYTYYNDANDKMSFTDQQVSKFEWEIGGVMTFAQLDKKRIIRPIINIVGYNYFFNRAGVEAFPLYEYVGYEEYKEKMEDDNYYPKSELIYVLWKTPLKERAIPYQRVILKESIFVN